MSTAHPHRPGVNVVTMRLWRLRLVRALPRYLLLATAGTGLLASARFALFPPRPTGLAAPVAPSSDPAAAAFASLFARRYLSWSAREPQMHRRALEPFTGEAMDPDAGLRVPATGEERVEWSEVVQDRQPQPGEHVYTVAAQTDAEGLLYLTVDVSRNAEGALVLGGYPAFVGPPAYSAASDPSTGELPEVQEPALEAVVRRALTNYLSGAASDLAADLTSGARVSTPPVALALQSMRRLQWTSGGRSVLAQVQALDSHGVEYALAYELDVARAQGRWEIAAIQTDPNS